MTKDEALDLALEALENSYDYVAEEADRVERMYGNYPTRQGKIKGLRQDERKHMEAITAIKQALAAPTVQEPVRWSDYEPDGRRYPAVPDAFGTREGEHPQYIQGWNDCRAEMLKGMKP